MLKKVILVVTISYTIFLAVVSLIKLDNLPDINVSFGDKIFHFGAYAVLAFLWFYTFLLQFKVAFKKAIFRAVIFSILFGIILEVLQGSMTAYRALDVYDALANSLGALLASLVIWFTKSFHVKNI